MPKKRKKKQNSSKGLIIAIIILVLVFMLLMGGVLYYFLVLQPAQRAEKKVVGGQREAAALQGSLEVKTEEEIQEELNNIVDEGMFRISIASTITGVEHGKADVRIENNPSNRYIMQVSIYLDETGEEVYATDLIDPGYYIESVELDEDLKAGEYNATAIFTALYPDTEEIVGTAGAQVKLLIMPAGATSTPSPSPSPSPSASPEA